MCSWSQVVAFPALTVGLSLFYFLSVSISTSLSLWPAWIFGLWCNPTPQFKFPSQSEHGRRRVSSQLVLVNSTDGRRDFQFAVPPSVFVPAQPFSSMCVCCVGKGKNDRRKREKEEWSAGLKCWRQRREGKWVWVRACADFFNVTLT